MERGAYPADGSYLVSCEGIVGLIQRGLDVLGVLHGLALLFQFLLLALREFGVLQFFVLELQKVQILAVALYVVLHFLQLSICRLQLAIGLLIGCQFFLVVGDDVYHVQLEVLLLQQQVLMLGMDVN